MRRQAMKFAPARTHEQFCARNPSRNVINNQTVMISEISDFDPVWSPTPTLAYPLSSSNKFSGRQAFYQTNLQCFNSELTKPYRNPSGRSRAMSRNVSPCRGFSLRPKFCFDAPPEKYCLYDSSIQIQESSLQATFVEKARAARQ